MDIITITIESVVKNPHLLRCCQFYYHYEVLWYAEIIAKCNRLQYEVFT